MPTSQPIASISLDQDNTNSNQLPSYNQIINQPNQIQLQPGFNLSRPEAFRVTDSSSLPPPSYNSIDFTSTKILHE